MTAQAERRRDAAAIGPRVAVLDAIVRHTSRRLGGAPTFIGVVGSGRPYLRSEVGLPGQIWRSPELPRLDSLTLLVGGRAEPLILAGPDRAAGEDAAEDLLARLGFDSLIGLPLRDQEGAVLGSFCALTDAPRHWSDRDLTLAADMANLAASEIEVGNARDVAPADLDPEQVRERIEDEFSAAASAEEALGATLECLCTTLGWEIGTAWLEGDGGLRKAAHWHRPSLAYESFTEVCDELSFSRGEDMVGGCWARGEASWRTALPPAGEFSRAAVAETAGLQCGAWMPLGSGPEALGAIELLGAAEVPEHARTAPELGALGELIGDLLGALGPAPAGGARGPFRGLPGSAAW